MFRLARVRSRVFARMTFPEMCADSKAMNVLHAGFSDCLSLWPLTRDTSARCDGPLFKPRGFPDVVEHVQFLNALLLSWAPWFSRDVNS